MYYDIIEHWPLHGESAEVYILYEKLSRPVLIIFLVDLLYYNRYGIPYQL